MRVSIVLTLLYLLAVPRDTAAQAWREAYDRKEFTRAAALLESLVFDRPSGPTAKQRDMWPNAEAAERLATMYLQGVGVPRDPVLACTLFFEASRAALYEADEAGQLDGPDPRFDRRREEVCGALSADDQDEAWSLISCVRFGPDLQAFTLGSGHWVQISRKGILVHYREADRQHELTPMRFCGERFTHARHVRVAPKAAEGRTRHFSSSFRRGRRMTPRQRGALRDGN